METTKSISELIAGRKKIVVGGSPVELTSILCERCLFPSVSISQKHLTVTKLSKSYWIQQNSDCESITAVCWKASCVITVRQRDLQKNLATSVPKHHLWKTPSSTLLLLSLLVIVKKRRFKVSKLPQHFWKLYPLNLPWAGGSLKARHAICNSPVNSSCKHCTGGLSQAHLGAVWCSQRFIVSWPCTVLNRRQAPGRHDTHFFLKYFSSALQKADPLRSNGKRKRVLLILQTAEKAYLSWS